MKIGVPKEIKPQENRIGLTPESVKTLVSEGHEVLVENNGGFEAGFDNDQYTKAGAKIVKNAEQLGVKIYWNSTVVNTFGHRKISSVDIMNLSEDGSNVVGEKNRINCDCLAISGGWTPMVHMHTQSGGKLDFREIDQTFIPN